MRVTYEYKRKYGLQLLFHYSDKRNTDYGKMFFGVCLYRVVHIVIPSENTWWHMVLMTTAL
jgi:hypothetical protein